MKDPRDIIVEPVVSEKSYSLIDDGKYTEKLRGDGALSLDSIPGEAEVWLYELEESDLKLVPTKERRLGVTPIVGLFMLGLVLLPWVKSRAYAEPV